MKLMLGEDASTWGSVLVHGCDGLPNTLSQRLADGILTPFMRYTSRQPYDLLEEVLPVLLLTDLSVESV
jgi:hypothetical protein